MTLQKGCESPGPEPSWMRAQALITRQDAFTHLGKRTAVGQTFALAIHRVCIYALLPFKVYLVANAKRKRELSVRFNLFESQDTPKLKPE